MRLLFLTITIIVIIIYYTIIATIIIMITAKPSLGQSWQPLGISHARGSGPEVPETQTLRLQAQHSASPAQPSDADDEFCKLLVRRVLCRTYGEYRGLFWKDLAIPSERMRYLRAGSAILCLTPGLLRFSTWVHRGLGVRRCLRDFGSAEE